MITIKVRGFMLTQLFYIKCGLLPELGLIIHNHEIKDLSGIPVILGFLG